jgi:hypothetical protein
MKKLAITMSFGVFALSASVAYCPSAAAGPACPYDMSTAAGRAAFQQAIVSSSQQVGSNQRAYGPNGNPALATNDINNERSTSNMILACQGINSPPLPPVAQPLPPQPQVNTNTAPPTVDGQCQRLSDAWNSLDPLTTAEDRISKLKHIPGIGEVSAAQLIGCSIGDLPTTLMNPSRENQSDVFSGFCNGADALVPFPTGDPCGNTPAG